MDARRNDFCTELIIQPFIQRLIAYRALENIPDNEDHEATVEWPTARESTPLEKAQTSNARMQAVSTYLTGQCEQLISKKKFLMDELDYTENEAEESLSDADVAAAQDDAQAQKDAALATSTAQAKAAAKQPAVKPMTGTAKKAGGADTPSAPANPKGPTAAPRGLSNDGYAIDTPIRVMFADREVEGVVCGVDALKRTLIKVNNSNEVVALPDLQEGKV